jgi:hypothetical protein
MQKEPDLVGAGSRAGGPIRGQVKLFSRFSLSGSIFARRAAAPGQVGDDIAGVDPIGSGFDPGDDPALAVPGLPRKSM